MARYAIAGFRPGEHLHTPHGRYATHEIDGAVLLNDDQKAALEKAGYRLTPAADVAPGGTPAHHVLREEVAADSAEAARRAEGEIAANRAVAEKISADAQRVRKPAGS